MANKVIKLSEKDLHYIISESVNAVLNENDDKMQANAVMQESLKLLRELTHSGYIPFSSPSPSSTEMIIKKNIMQAIDLISKAIIADRQLYRR